ncbi:aspartate kinase [Tumebacillus permanentifrigoris]|uniref:Aspartokinase n=1 Tax=Tumebacillus permanentifrigoris TaxID=378543 RepID=A0A316D7E3_9BACL|nr:aspartate kinase [Tumebacillus permanentifrigoris]PWK12653.1 aspartate kinase [Tumebacillus permanentifrigoris]
MRILVQKFGGTSVAKRETREKAIEHILDARRDGYSVVVVVSAMGRKGDPYATDSLLSILGEQDRTNRRELDMLMSCGELISAVSFAGQLRGHGVEATVLNGGQAGIITNEEFSRAQIVTINPKRILQELQQDRVVIVTGFQGATQNQEITTLGRGGSDTSATALGVALDAEIVDIFTDVEGIMTADPRIVDNASRLNTVTYAEICNLAYQGAKVIHPRAVEIAMQKNIPIRVRSTMSKDEGTLVTNHLENNRIEDPLNDRMVTGITQTANVTQIKVFATVGQHSDMQRSVFRAMADNSISVDLINVNPRGVAYTVTDQDTAEAVRVLQGLGYEPEVVPGCAKVAIVGAGMTGMPGVMAHIVEAIISEGIEILQSADSHTTIWVLVRGEDMVKAIRALHNKFQLHQR